MPTVLLDVIFHRRGAYDFNETNNKDESQLSPRISIRETRAYPYQKGECDKQGEIPRRPPLSYTIYSSTRALLSIHLHHP